MLAPWVAAAPAPSTEIEVRVEPHVDAAIQATYSNGTMLAMTGRCTDGINLLEMANWAPVRQEMAVVGKWCELWHDPERDGTFVKGWVAGDQISRD